MHTASTTDVRALARTHLLLKKYTIPFEGEGEDLRSRQSSSLATQIDKQHPYELQLAWNDKGICPEFFSVEMKWHWVNTLGNVVTEKLDRLWFSMAETYNRLLVAKPGDPWLILSPETGTGKTQGSCVYAALSALYTDSGILFTTRLTSQCDSVVRDIQQIAQNHCSRYQEGGRFGVLSPQDIALTVHSKQLPEERPSDSAIFNTSCLVITHESMARTYREVLENEGSFDEKGLARFDSISKWRNGLRIRITDETPSRLVEHFKLDQYAFKTLDFFLDDTLSVESKSQLELVKCIEKACRQYWEALSKNDEYDGAKVIALGDFLPTHSKPERFSLQGLFKAIREAPDTSSSVNRENIAGLKKDALQCLYALQHVANSWAVSLSNVGGKTIATSAWLITPPDKLPMCVLDATAFTTPFWKVLGAKVKHVAIERNIRDYRNVTAHLCYLPEGGVGKDALRKEIKNRLKSVMGYFKDEIPRAEKRRVLLCLPKSLKDKTKELATTEDDVTALKVPDCFQELKVGHWNALDGRNEFRDCDTVVILSWPYPPQNLSIDLLFAATDPSNRNDSFLRDSKAFRKELALGHVGASVIQAVNRVRCRKVTSEDGSCETTDIFMLMPKETSHDAKVMKETLEREMPGVVFRDWGILEQRKVRPGTHSDKLIDFLASANVERIVVSEALDQLGVSPSGQKDLRKKLNDPEGKLGRLIAAMGWTYSVDRQGQRNLAVLTRR